MLQYKRHQRKGSMLLKIIIMQRMYVIRHYLEHLLPSNAALMLQYSQQDGCQERISLTSPHYLKYTVLIRLQADLGYKPRPQTSHAKN